MNSLFYLAMLVGVGWLMIWAILPPDQRGKGWWPFDMRDGEAPEASAGATTEPAQRGRPMSGIECAAREPAAARDAQPSRAESPAAPVSWRVRRDKALSSRRGA